MASEAEQIVADFCNVWPKCNLDEIMTFFTEDAVYHNIPMEPAKGKAAIRAVINTFLPAAKTIEFKILKSASAGNTVFNERVDTFELKDDKRISLPVAGVFEVSGGKISAWRDYFDLAMYTRQMA